MDGLTAYTADVQTYPVLVAGSIYDPSSWWGGQSSTGVLVAGREYSIPVWIPRRGLSVDRLILNITAAGGAGKLARAFARIGLPNGMPGSIIPGADTGTIDANTIAANSVPVTTFFPPGVVYLCALSDGTPFIPFYANTVMRYMGVTAAGGTTARTGGYIDSQDVSAPSDPHPGSFVAFNGNQVYQIQFRVA